jgi:phenylalanyl-tRNA synthetase beta chain
VAQRRLRSIGLAPINNVVDVTNFVLHRLGQPLHAFDATPAGRRPGRVKRAAAGGRKVRHPRRAGTYLRAEDLVIADGHGTPLALAGVFLRKTSGVGRATTQVFLEAPTSPRLWLRKTAQTHQLKTDASLPLSAAPATAWYCRTQKRAALLLRKWLAPPSRPSSMSTGAISHTAVLRACGRSSSEASSSPRAHRSDPLTDLDIPHHRGREL